VVLSHCYCRRDSRIESRRIANPNDQNQPSLLLDDEGASSLVDICTDTRCCWVVPFKSDPHPVIASADMSFLNEMRVCTRSQSGGSM
jgi:hypothetical protein